MTDEPSIPPALTAEEWAAFIAGELYTEHERADFATWFEYNHGATPYAPQHGVAALALYGQPFGFTQEDVALLYGVDDYNAGRRDAVARLVNLAARIAALLPPEEHP
jgi:hypothetical protein